MRRLTCYRPSARVACGALAVAILALAGCPTDNSSSSISEYTCCSCGGGEQVFEQKTTFATSGGGSTTSTFETRPKGADDSAWQNIYFAGYRCAGSGVQKDDNLTCAASIAEEKKSNPGLCETATPPQFDNSRWSKCTSDEVNIGATLGERNGRGRRPVSLTIELRTGTDSEAEQLGVIQATSDSEATLVGTIAKAPGLSVRVPMGAYQEASTTRRYAVVNKDLECLAYREVTTLGGS
ncbi:MAG: hypothetical protein R3A78_09750 [Polyangiales bacterium]